MEGSNGSRRLARGCRALTRCATLVACAVAAASCGSGDGYAAAEAGGPLTPTFSSIQANVFTPICVTCHSGASAPHGLRLDGGNSYALLVGVPSDEQPSILRVKPNDPDKLLGPEDPGHGGERRAHARGHARAAAGDDRHDPTMDHQRRDQRHADEQRCHPSVFDVAVTRLDRHDAAGVDHGRRSTARSTRRPSTRRPSGSSAAAATGCSATATTSRLRRPRLRCRPRTRTRPS